MQRTFTYGVILVALRSGQFALLVAVFGLAYFDAPASASVAAGPRTAMLDMV